MINIIIIYIVVSLLALANKNTLIECISNAINNAFDEPNNRLSNFGIIATNKYCTTNVDAFFTIPHLNLYSFDKLYYNY